MPKKVESVQLLNGNDLRLVLFERNLALVEVRKRSVIDAFVVRVNRASKTRKIKVSWKTNNGSI